MRKIGCISDKRPESLELKKKLVNRLGLIDLEQDKPDIDYILVLGGDGTLLRAMHKFLHLKKPFFGVNIGKVGFLLNNIDLLAFTQDDLFTSLTSAKKFTLPPIKMQLKNREGKISTAFAFNEVSVIRSSNQTANIAISLNGHLEMENLVADGILVATPAGSTAYNLSVGGAVLPLNANLLALTPISPFRPRRWRGALVHNNTKFSFTILNPKHRPVIVAGDFLEFHNIVEIQAEIIYDYSVTLLFDHEQTLEDRIKKEQFLS